MTEPRAATVPLREVLSQKEILEVTALSRELNQILSLYIVSLRNNAMACLCVAPNAEEAVYCAKYLGLEGWTMGNTMTRAVQRNVDMEPGAKMIIPIRARAYRFPSESARQRKQRQKRAQKARRGETQ